MASAAAVAAVVAATSKSMSPTVISSPTAYSSSSPLALMSPSAGSPSSTRGAFFNFSPTRTNQIAPTNTIHNLTSFAVMQISICNQDLAFPIYIQSMLDPEAVVINTPSAFLAGSSSLCKLTLGNSAIKERINGVLPHVNIKASFLSLEEGSSHQHGKVESIHFCTQPGVYGPEIVPNQIDVVYSAEKIGDYELQIMINNFEVPAIHITVGSLRAQQGKIRVIKPRVHEGEHARALLHMELRDDLNREIAFNIEQVSLSFQFSTNHSMISKSRHCVFAGERRVSSLFRRSTCRCVRAPSASASKLFRNFRSRASCWFGFSHLSGGAATD
jgi:hypothetical protein